METFQDITGLSPKVTPAHMMSTPSMTPEQQELLKQLIGQVSPQIGEGVSPYPGQIAPGASNLQRGGFDVIQDILEGGGAYGTGGEALNRILGGTPETSLTARMGPTKAGIMGTVGPTSGGFDKKSAVDYWTKAIKEPAMQTWEKEIIPKVLEPFVSAGGLSSGAARRAVAESGRNLTTDITGKLADVLYKGEQAGAERGFRGKESFANRIENALGREFGAGESYRERVGGTERSYLDRLLGTIPQAINYAMTPAQLALKGGGVERGILSEQGQEAFNKWNMAQPYNNPWLNMGMNLLNLKPFTSGMAQASSTPGWGQNLMGILGRTKEGASGLFGSVGK